VNFFLPGLLGSTQRPLLANVVAKNDVRIATALMLVLLIIQILISLFPPQRHGSPLRKSRSMWRLTKTR
jgi:hypothetical protein